MTLAPRPAAALRVAAVAIAAAAAIDPAVTVSGAMRARVAVVAQTPAAEAERTADRVARDLERDYDVVRDVVSDVAATIVVGDRYPAEAFPETSLVATVTLPTSPGKGVRIVRALAPREVPAATTIRVGVEVAGGSVVGQTTQLAARIGGVEVGRASHAWTADSERWRAALDVVPVGEPPFVVRLEATQPGAAAAAADVVVYLRPPPVRVEFYDPRPSWPSTFVRRALESDARFRVESLTFSARGIAARSPDAVAIADPRLDAFDAVVVGGLGRLTDADVRALDRYMRDREGAVVLVPDEIVRGPARVLAPDAAERLLERPARLRSQTAAPLQASELLVARDLPPGAGVLAATADDNGAVIASVPRGGGRLLVSGALDAWRFRALDDAAFDRFWRSAIAGAALASPPVVDVAVAPPMLRPLESGDVVVRVRSPQLTSVSAAVDGQPVRLLPEAEAGVYRGRIVAPPRGGSLHVEARAAGTDAAAYQIGRRIVPVARDVRRPAPEIVAPLALLSASHGGIDASADRLADVEQFVRRTVVAPRAAIARRPMRSPWWLAAFVCCLTAEWYHRRRRGVR